MSYVIERVAIRKTFSLTIVLQQICELFTNRLLATDPLTIHQRPFTNGYNNLANILATNR